jgi:polar amino acid transport system substrate-binding protein
MRLMRSISMVRVLVWGGFQITGHFLMLLCSNFFRGLGYPGTDKSDPHDLQLKGCRMRWKVFGIIACLAGQLGLAHAQPVVLVSGNDYAPYADSRLAEGGMVTELVKAAFAHAQRAVVMEWKPWARGMEEAKQGKFAGTFPYLRNAEREKDFLYSDEVVSVRSTAFVKAGNTRLDFSNIVSLAGTTYCLPVGWAPTPKLAEMVASGHIKVTTPDSISSCAKMVAFGRADYFVYGDIQVAHGIKDRELPAGSIAIVESEPLALTPLYFLASKTAPGSAQLIESFNEGLKAIRKNGLYGKIVKAHSTARPPLP